MRCIENFFFFLKILYWVFKTPLNSFSFFFPALSMLGVSVFNEPCKLFYGQMPFLTLTLPIHPGLGPALSWAGLPPVARLLLLLLLLMYSASTFCWHGPFPGSARKWIWLGTLLWPPTSSIFCQMETQIEQKWVCQVKIWIRCRILTRAILKFRFSVRLGRNERLG